MFKPQSNIKRMNDNRQSAAKQIFKPVKGWEDLYEVTNDGKIYSIRQGKFLKPRLSLDGYERVVLCKDGVRREMRVHRIVAEAFLENPNGLQQVNHKDFNTINNYVSNLEWCTNQYNSNYSSERRHKILYRDDVGRIKIYKSVRFTNVYNNNSFTILGLKNVAKQFGCSRKLVSQIIKKYANTGAYVKQGYFKGLRLDVEYLKVQRLVNNDVASSEAKCETPHVGEDIV